MSKPLSIAKKLAHQNPADISVEQYLAIKNTPSQHQRLNQTEVIRKSLGKVRSNQAVTEVMRKSPRRVYSGVKSKVAGNIKTQNRVTGKQVRSTWQAITDLEEKGLSNSYLKATYPRAYTAVLKKPSSGRKSASTNFSSSKKVPKKPVETDYQDVIERIKSRIGEEDVNNMSVEELQKEIMSKHLAEVLKEQNPRQPASSMKAGPSIEIEEDTPEFNPNYPQYTPQEVSYTVQGLSPKRKKRVSYRPKSPNKSPRKSNMMMSLATGDENVHRAVARGMYYDEVVNVVTGGRNSPSKVKRGGMNYFLPSKVGKVPLTTAVTGLVRDEEGNIGLIDSPSKYYSPRKAAWGNLDYELSSVGVGKMRSDTLRQKTEQVQREFDKLAEEMLNRRSGSPVKMTGVIEALDYDIYCNKEKKHKSPTKRLINQKNSLHEHKKRLYEMDHRIYNQLPQGEYSQIYSVQPGQTVVIEAQEGELPYDIADQSPRKFYNMVLNQDVLRCNVKNRGRLVFEWTHRPLIKILTTVKDKFINQIVGKYGEQFRPDVENAFAPGGKTEGQLKQMIESGAVDLLDDDRKLVFQGLSDEHPAVLRRPEAENLLDEEEGAPANIKVSSPDARRLAKSELTGEGQAAIESEVLKFIRQNSLVDGAKHI